MAGKYRSKFDPFAGRTLDERTTSVEEFPFVFEVSGKTYTGTMQPIGAPRDGVHWEFFVYCRYKLAAVLRYKSGEWEMPDTDKEYVQALGEFVALWYG